MIIRKGDVTKKKYNSWCTRLKGNADNGKLNLLKTSVTWRHPNRKSEWKNACIKTLDGKKTKTLLFYSFPLSTPSNPLNLTLRHIKYHHTAAAAWGPGRSHNDQTPRWQALLNLIPVPFVTTALSQTVSCSSDPGQVQVCVWQRLMERHVRCEVEPEAPETEELRHLRIGSEWFSWSCLSSSGAVMNKSCVADTFPNTPLVKG